MGSIVMTVRRNRSCTAAKQDKHLNVRWTWTTLITGSSLMVIPFVAAYANGPAETSAAISESTQGNEELQEIVVTARRRDEVLQDVPQTVNAVNSGEIQRLNLQNLQDLSGIVPGLQIASSAQATNNNDTLRGVSFNPSTGTQNTVAFYLN